MISGHFGSGLDRINKISGRFGFGLDHFGFRINSGQHDYGSVRFWVGSILVSDRIRFRSFGCRFGFGFESFGSVHSVRVSFVRSKNMSHLTTQILLISFNRSTK